MTLENFPRKVTQPSRCALYILTQPHERLSNELPEISNHLLDDDSVEKTQCLRLRASLVAHLRGRSSPARPIPATDFYPVGECIRTPRQAHSIHNETLQRATWHPRSRAKVTGHVKSRQCTPIGTYQRLGNQESPSNWDKAALYGNHRTRDHIQIY